MTRAAPPSTPRGARPARSPVAYALEGSVFVSGAGVQWLRDGLGIIDDSADIGAVGPHGGVQRGGGGGAGLHRAREPPVGPRGAGHHRGPQPGHRPGPPGPGHDRGHGLPGPRRGRRHGGHRHRARRSCGSTAVPRPWTSSSSCIADQSRLPVIRPVSAGDHRHRGGHPGRTGRGRVGHARRPRRPVDRGGRLRPLGAGRRCRARPPGLATRRGAVAPLGGEDQARSRRP